MNFNIDMIVIGQIVIAAAVVLGVKSLIRMSRCLIALTTWKEEHVKQEKQWHEENREEHKAMRDRLDQIANGAA